MALQSVLFFDIVAQTQTLTFILNKVHLDQLIFSKDEVTLAETPGFALPKNDFILYNNFLLTFQNAINVNFPELPNANNTPLPFSTFNIQLENKGLKNIYYNQTSQGNIVYNTDYIPEAKNTSFVARKRITITMQEFFLMCAMHNTYTQQVNLS